MLKLAIGLILAVFVGIGCRWCGIPLPGPPAIMGAAMAVAMATGYTATDYLLTRDKEPSLTVGIAVETKSPAGPAHDNTDQMTAAVSKPS